MKNTEDFSQILYARIVEQVSPYKLHIYEQKDRQGLVSKVGTIDAYPCASIATYTDSIKPRRLGFGAKGLKRQFNLQGICMPRGSAVNVYV